jgi:hypothetical protein
MAAVVRARDTQLDRIVALKILPPEMAGESDNVQRFQHEARAAAKLDHENIARVFYCGEDQGLYFIAFEFVEGETLRAIFEKQGVLTVPAAIGYMLQIASGLAHAAARGVIHRDIKPSNIIIAPSGRAKLVDMGLARSLEAPSDGGLTRSGVTLGTFDYISPEQAMEPREADVRSDIYSLGCTFYHLLTGRPPVPEGTAAKKIHHQQSVAPIDPRQLNAAIPDEVAALLARMMAKDPADRFQDPETLVKHLLVLAGKFGDAAENSEGVLLIDALVPSPPRIRPWLWAMGAAAALVILVILVAPPAPWPLSGPGANAVNLGQFSRGVPAEPGTVPAPNENGEIVRSINASTAPIDGAASVPAEPATARELAALLQKGDSSVTVSLSKDLNLSRDDQLVFQGRELTIQAKDPNLPPTIRLEYDGSPSAQPWAALTVKSGRVRIEGIRFVINSREASELSIAAVALEGGQALLKRCEFVQEYPPNLPEGHVNSVMVRRLSQGGDRPSLELAECYFGEGQHAATVAGPVNLKCSQCAFAPQISSVFNIERSTWPEESDSPSVILARATSLVRERSVFRLDDGAACRMDVRECVFSSPDATAPGGAGAFIEQAGERPAELDYRGFGNCYHNLKYLWVRTLDDRNGVTDVDGFRSHPGCHDERSFTMAFSPWESPDPIRALRARELRQAYRLNTALAQLRQSRSRTQLIGVDSCVWGNSYDQLSALAETSPGEAAARPGERIVDPSVPGQSGSVHQTLRQAIEAAAPGDSILIKHNGVLKVDPVRLERAGLDITIRPYANCQPVLSIGETTEPDAALFRVYDGRLTLEQLEIRLQTPQADFKAQTAVAIMGDGQCSLKRCVATLEQTKEVRLSLVTLADPSSIMKMNPQTAAGRDPRIEITDCFVRGAGDLVTVRASRAFDLNVENSLIAIDGSVLVVDGNPSPREVVVRAHSGTLTLNQVTAYLTDHLVWLRAHRQDGMSARGLIPTQVRAATNCLFVSANGKSLVHLDGVDTDEQMKRSFGWSDGRHNAYSNFTTWLDQKPSGESEAMSPVPYGRTQWESFGAETDSRFERIRINDPPAPEMPLARALPENFKLPADATSQGYGAEIDRLPRPYEGAVGSRNP